MSSDTNCCFSAAEIFFDWHELEEIPEGQEIGIGCGDKTSKEMQSQCLTELLSFLSKYSELFGCGVDIEKSGKSFFSYTT